MIFWGEGIIDPPTPRLIGEVYVYNFSFNQCYYTLTFQLIEFFVVYKIDISLFNNTTQNLYTWNFFMEELERKDENYKKFANAEDFLSSINESF